MALRTKPKTVLASRDAQPYTTAEVAQADEDYRLILARLGDGLTDEKFTQAALRLCFADATGLSIVRRRRDR
jgi:hypothetical protein